MRNKEAHIFDRSSLSLSLLAMPETTTLFQATWSVSPTFLQTRRSGVDAASSTIQPSPRRMTGPTLPKWMLKSYLLPKCMPLKHTLPSASIVQTPSSAELGATGTHAPSNAESRPAHIFWFARCCAAGCMMAPSLVPSSHERGNAASCSMMCSASSQHVGRATACIEGLFSIAFHNWVPWSAESPHSEATPSAGASMVANESHWYNSSSCSMYLC
mmetsp:Transcript_142489/g.355144  ORF Transcript_142489/g.355144 Transcript_142489/m.355144 type:complete len:215 (+) Transcript_142489:1790-2434(+)